MIVRGLARPAKIRMLAGSGDFDVTKISFSFDGRYQSLEKPYIYDLPEIKGKETIVVEAQIKIPQEGIGYLLKATFFTEIYLIDHRNPEAATPASTGAPTRLELASITSQSIPGHRVCHHREVTLPEANFIQQTCDFFGLRNNFYDISMHGSLDLFKPLPHFVVFSPSNIISSLGASRNAWKNLPNLKIATTLSRQSTISSINAHGRKDRVFKHYRSQ
jgi:hypothetical protein